MTTEDRPVYDMSGSLISGCWPAPRPASELPPIDPQYGDASFDILIFDGVWQIGFYDYVAKLFTNWVGLECRVTHWMPLPPKPA